MGFSLVLETNVLRVMQSQMLTLFSYFKQIYSNYCSTIWTITFLKIIIYYGSYTWIKWHEMSYSYDCKTKIQTMKSNIK